LHDMIIEDIAKIYPELLKYISINLVQSGDHILNTFDKQISEFTEKQFKREGINVLINTRVIEVEKKKSCYYVR